MVAQAVLRAEPALNPDPLLSVRNVSVRFGGIVALDGVSFDVAPGEIAGSPTTATSCSRAARSCPSRPTPSPSWASAAPSRTSRCSTA
jgi:hypothetical protein